MTRGPRRAPAERATIDGMEHVRTGVQRRTLIGAGIAVLAFGGVIGAFAATDDDSGPRQEISDTAETTTTTEAPTTTVEVTTTAVAPAAAVPVVTAAPAPQPLEVVVEDHEERIDQLEATTTTQPATVDTVPIPPSKCGPADTDGCES